MKNDRDAPREDVPDDGSGFNRRNLLKSIHHSRRWGPDGPDGSPGEGRGATARAIPGRPALAKPPGLTETDVLAKARERLYPTCRVCPVCDGVACSGDAGGIAGSGPGMSFQNNFTALQRVKLLMRNVHDVTQADTSTTIFGRKISFPAVCAPMGPAGTKFGKGMTQQEWFDALVGGCVAAGTSGRGGRQSRPTPIEDVKRNLAVVERFQGKALYNSKPIPNEIILKWHAADRGHRRRMAFDRRGFRAQERGATARIGEGFQNARGGEGHHEARRRYAMRSMPASPASPYRIMAAAGRTIPRAPPRCCRRLPSKLKGKIPILTDGCVATGTDVLKYLALGADVVMVGRHILRAAYGGGADGVALFMNRMRAELQSAMVLTGVALGRRRSIAGSSSHDRESHAIPGKLGAGGGCGCAALPGPGSAGAGGRLPMLSYRGGGQGKVVFDHQLHASEGFRCNDCHTNFAGTGKQLVATRKQGLITLADHTKRREVFCLSQWRRRDRRRKSAFNDCGRCHRKIGGF